jgi:TRAP-type mannitol/chloroaromatic compound transport system permease large subunit
VLIFILGCFLDFFEIAFILLPLLAPVAVKLDIDLVWFGIIVAMNLQTSFLTPPFGFALFYLRSVAPAQDYDDRITRKRITGMSTVDIYKGSVAFVCVQLVMLVAVIAFPTLSIDPEASGKKINIENIRIEIPDEPADTDSGTPSPGGAPGTGRN